MTQGCRLAAGNINNYLTGISDLKLHSVKLFQSPPALPADRHEITSRKLINLGKHIIIYGANIMKKSRLISAVSYVALALVSTSSIASTISLSSIDESGSTKSFSGELLNGAGNPTVGVILLHGRNGSADGVVVSELRQSINIAGYTTLSIDEPVPAAGTSFQDYVDDVNGANTVFPELYARVRTAANTLESLGVDEIVLLGFSLGGRMASAHVARGQIDELSIVGLIGIGLYGNSIDPLNTALTLDEVPIPVLDIFGDNDTNAVNTAAARLSAYNSGSGTDYTQMMVECVNAEIDCVPHNFSGYRGTDNPVLETEVNLWLASKAPLSAIPLPGAIYLFGAGLLGLFGIARRKKA